jgi:hypothetical protein
MIIKRFFKVKRYEKIISNFRMTNLGLFETFYVNLHTRSQTKELWVRLAPAKFAAPPAPALQHCLLQ